MTVFDLVFLISFLTAAGTLIVALIAAIRGHGTRAKVLGRRVGIGAATYFAAVLVVSLFTPQRYARVDDDECSDDWCIAVQAVDRDTMNTESRYDVTFRLSSRAGRIAQREHFVVAYLRDERGREYTPLPDPNAVPFDTLLRAGERLTATRRFIVPAGAKVAGVVVTREGGGRVPGCCIIGDESSLFHRRTIIRLD